MADESTRSQIFVSYSHKDRKWLEELKAHLQPFIHDATLTSWDDTQIKPGDRWVDEITRTLSSASIAVLLVTTNYLASRFVASVELPQMFRRRAVEGLRIIWVPVGASAYMVTDLKDYQAASDPKRPLDTLPASRRAKVWVEIAETIANCLPHLAADAGAAECIDERSEQGNVVLLYKWNAAPDDQLLQDVERDLRAAGVSVFVDRHLRKGLYWAEAVARRMEKAGAVIPFLSAASVLDETLAYELDLARRASEKHGGRPRILPVRIALDAPLPPALAVFEPIPHTVWKTPEDNARVVKELVAAIKGPPQPLPVYVPPVGGALAPGDSWYIERPSDVELNAAIQRHEAFVLLRGAGQTGKTSMIARALSTARNRRVRTVYLDFQKMNENQLADTEVFYKSIMEWLSDELDLGDDVDQFWSKRRSPTPTWTDSCNATSCPRPAHNCFGPWTKSTSCLLTLFRMSSSDS
jgi:nucleotide-binding universal stress UspA family protein